MVKNKMYYVKPYSLAYHKRWAKKMLSNLNLRSSEEKIKVMKNTWDEKAKNGYYWTNKNTQSPAKYWNKEGCYRKGVEEVLSLVIPFLRENDFKENDLKQMKVLDVGCGVGRFTAALARYFGFVDGIDISEKMIEFAKKDNKNIDNARFYVGSGKDLKEFPDNYYDFVFSFVVFQHILQKSIVINYLKEIYRVLKSGRFMKVQVRGYPGYLPLGLAGWRYKGFNSFFVALSEIRRIPFLHPPLLKIKKYDTSCGVFFKKDELEKIMKEIGYSDVKLFYDSSFHMKSLWVSAKKQ